MIVPFPAGGSTDLAARLVARRFSEVYRHQFVVDNRPGGGGQIAFGALTQAPADGHTLLMGDIGVLAINPSVYERLSYDPQRDLQAIGMVMSSPMVLITSAKSEHASLQKLLGKAVLNPVSYASQGNGTGGHLAAELLRTEAQVPMLHVPYQGGAPALQAVIAGEVDCGFFVLGVALRHVQSGTVRALGLAASTRSPRVPMLPTFGELGHPRVEMNVWTGLVTRKNVPPPVVQQLNTELVKAVASPEVIKPLSDQGYDPQSGGVDEFAALMRTERTKWEEISRATGARVQ